MPSAKGRPISVIFLNSFVDVQWRRYANLRLIFQRVFVYRSLRKKITQICASSTSHSFSALYFNVSHQIREDPQNENPYSNPHVRCLLVPKRVVFQCESPIQKLSILMFLKQIQEEPQKWDFPIQNRMCGATWSMHWREIPGLNHDFLSRPKDTPAVD